MEESLLEIEKRERQRIGLDLHDDLGQLLTGVAFKAISMERKLQDNLQITAEEVSDIVSLIVKATHQMKILSIGLSPIVKKGEESLMIAMQQIASNTQQLFSIPCVVRCDEPVFIHNEKAVLQLYRIAQEAVTNAVRHARPRQVEIFLNKENDLITITVKDNGKGFNRIPERTNTMGLQIMKYRASIIGASLDIQSDPDKGTSITCTFHDRINYIV